MQRLISDGFNAHTCSKHVEYILNRELEHT